MKNSNAEKILRNAAQSNAQQHNDYQGGYVIEGEAIRETEAMQTVSLGKVNNVQT